jgi:hypothetical protein
MLICKNVSAVDPSVTVYIDHLSYTSSRIMEFDIMMKANGSTSTFQLRTFQAGLFVNSSWINGGTPTIQNVSSYTQMSGLGYNGSFQWNVTDKLINCSVNFDVLGPVTCIYTTVNTTPLIVTRIRVTNTADFSCASTPDIKFNYVSQISPLRLRTSFSWREVACTTNYDMFYPGRTYGGTAVFNGENYTTTDADGKSPVSSLSNIGFCVGQLELTAFIEGFYDNSTGLLRPGLLNCGILHAQDVQSDSVTIELHSSSNTAIVAATFKTILHSNGKAYCLFSLSGGLVGNSYYIVVKHRNAIETWSSNPVVISSRTAYNFSDNITKAFGNNMIRTADNLFWAFYSGDISDAATTQIGLQDGLIESQDYGDMENALSIYLSGYVYEDITGDGLVESEDYSTIENNLSMLVSSIHP